MVDYYLVFLDQVFYTILRDMTCYDNKIRKLKGEKVYYYSLGYSGLVTRSSRYLPSINNSSGYNQIRILQLLYATSRMMVVTL